jgi:hypothetical protein
MNKKQLQYLKETFLPGVRIRLISMFREPQLPAGLTGVVVGVDDAGGIHTRWENGSSLALICDVDQFIAFVGPTAEEHIREKYMPDEKIRMYEKLPGCVKAVETDTVRLVKEMENYTERITGITSNLAAITQTIFKDVE